MAKATLPRRLIRDIERTLQDRVTEAKNKIAEHYEQRRAELREVASTFGVAEDELFALAGVPKPEQKKRRRRKVKKVVKTKVVARKKTKKKVATRKKTVAKKRRGGTAEEKVAALLKKNPTASAADVSKATGYTGNTVYTTKAWKNRPRSK